MQIKVVTGGVIEKDSMFLLVQENKKICKENRTFRQVN